MSKMQKDRKVLSRLTGNEVPRGLAIASFHHIFLLQIFLISLERITPPVRVDTAYGVFEKTGAACFQLSILGQRGTLAFKIVSKSCI